MKSRMIRRILCAVAALLLAASLISCGERGGEPDEPEYTPTWAGSMGQFDITYCWGPHGAQYTDGSFYEKIAEAGFTSIPLEGGAADSNKTALALMKQYGLTCSALGDIRITDLAYYDATQEQVDEIVSAVVEEYSEFDNIRGWLLIDEPGTGRFERLGKVVRAFKKYDPDRTVGINLFPLYATVTQLEAKGYQDYLDRFVEEVDPHYLSYDHYAFLAGGRPRMGYFKNLEYVRDKAMECGLDSMQIILLTKHLDYADLTYDQIEWEVNTSLAYGLKRISYFTFILDQDLLNDGWTNACMSYTGEIYPHYYDVQKINRWLLPLGSELYGKTSVGVYHVLKNARDELEPMCEEYAGFGDLGAIEGANFLIGFFDDGSFYIVSKYTDGTKNGNNPLVFSDVESGLEFFDPETASWKDAEENGVVFRNADGKLEKSFDAAEGMLFRVRGK